MQFNSFEYLFFFLPLVVGFYSAFRTSVINKYIIFVASCLFLRVGPSVVLGSDVCFCFHGLFHGSTDRRQHEPAQAEAAPMDEHCFQSRAHVFLQIHRVQEDDYNGSSDWHRFSGFTIVSAPIHLILPPGVSFYTFETISYTVDVYRGEFKPRRRLLDYLSFIVFFPHLGSCSHSPSKGAAASTCFHPKAN